MKKLLHDDDSNPFCLQRWCCGLLSWLVMTKHLVILNSKVFSVLYPVKTVMLLYMCLCLYPWLMSGRL